MRFSAVTACSLLLFSLHLRPPCKAACGENVTVLFPLGQTLRCPGVLALLNVCFVNQRWVSAGHQQKPRGKEGMVRGRVCHVRPAWPCHPRQLFLFGFWLQSLSLSWTCIPSFIFQGYKPCHPQGHKRSSFHPWPKGICTWILSFFVFLWGSHKNRFDN